MIKIRMIKVKVYGKNLLLVNKAERTKINGLET